MATTLYLRTDIDTDLSGLGLTHESHSAAFPMGVDQTLGTGFRSLSTNIGVLASSISGVGAATALHQDNLFGLWISLPLDYQTIPAGTWDFAGSGNSGGLLHGAEANSYFGLSLYVWRPTGQILRIADPDKGGAEWTFGPGNFQATQFTFPGALVTGVCWGDRLVLEVWRHGVQDNAFANTQTFFFDGSVDPVGTPTTANPASRLIAPADLVFASGDDPQAIIGSGRVSGKRVTMEPWFVCGICGIRFPRSEMVLLKTPNVRAGTRVCTRWCSDEVDYGDRRRQQRPLIGTDETYRGDE